MMLINVSGGRFVCGGIAGRPTFFSLGSRRFERPNDITLEREMLSPR
jgi:hypothetical protein